MPSLPLLSLTPSTLSTPLWSPATPRSPPLPPSPPEPSMLPRGRLRLTPTTTEDMEDTVSDTGATDTDTVSDTAVASSGVRFCLDVLDLDATTLCPWIGSRWI